MEARHVATSSENRSQILRSLTIIALATLLIAASWRGVADAPEDPRTWSNTQIGQFIYASVNTSLSIGRWYPRDTVTICEAGTSNCILVAYINPMSQYAWAKAKNVNSREKPPDVSRWDRFIEWLLGRGGVPSDTSLEALIADWSSVPEGSVTVEALRPDDTLTKCTGCHGSDWQEIARGPAWGPLRNVPVSDWLALSRSAGASTDTPSEWSMDDWRVLRMFNGEVTSWDRTS